MQPVQYIRVINGQTLPRSILLDKIDRSSAQFETDITYAQQAKQKVYVPYTNPVDPTVAGYVDLVPTDEVLLQVNQPHGVIFQLAQHPVGAVTKYISYFGHHGSLTVAPTVTGGVHTPGVPAVPAGTHLSIAAAVAPTTPVSRTGANAQPFNTSAANANKLNIRASSTAVFTQIVTTSGIQSAAQVVSDLNSGFATAHLPFVASQDLTGHVIITSTITGPTSYIEMSTTAPSAGTLSTVLGLTITPLYGIAEAQVTDATANAWTAADVGNDIIIPGGGNVTIPANAGTFKIVSFTSISQVGIANPLAAADGNNGAITWTEATESTVNITGTTFTSLTPDHTYVILTNLVGVSQTISDSQIIAAGPPNSIGATSIVIDYALITIGTPAPGWKIVVQANSKKSAVPGHEFIMT